jgi:large subunit ribosomal protein L3
MKFILGKKIEMTERFKEDGKFVAVTAVEAGPCVVTQVKTKEKDGYEAVQLGFGEAKRLNKPEAGHLRPSGGKFTRLTEFPATDADDLHRPSARMGPPFPDAGPRANQPG